MVTWNINYIVNAVREEPFEELQKMDIKVAICYAFRVLQIDSEERSWLDHLEKIMPSYRHSKLFREKEIWTFDKKRKKCIAKGFHIW